MEAAKKQVHIVLVHGMCHGAWCWYKVKPRLEAASHRVTVVDLVASGIHSGGLHELRTFDDYTKPLLDLMESLPPQEKVVLVGHSFGGLNLGLAMETHPQKIGVSVFLTAFMPDCEHKPSYAVEQYLERTPPEEWLDTEFLPCGTPEEPRTSVFFGPSFISSKLCQLCPAEDVALAEMLMRPGSLFVEDLSKKNAFSEEGFGSVKRVYIVCRKDKTIPESFQRWTIEINGVDEVKEMENADHMPMLSMPQQVCELLLEISNNYM